MSMPTPRLALIDVDGTLVDSVPDLAYCVDELMNQLGLPQRGEARVRQWVGNGVERLVRRALINNLEGEPEPALFDRAYPMFLDLYSVHTSERSRLFPGAREGLDFLKRSGARLGCVTNKAARFTEPLLRDLGVYDEFELVISGDSLPKKKPDPLPLLHAAEHFAVKPQEALLVGDSISDVKAARAAGFAVICVSYGYNHGLDIRAANPDAVVDSIAEIADLLAPSSPPVGAS
ncbi:MAG: phosphoglycolate phosphatase [Gammaproteobacteria bacterium]